MVWKHRFAPAFFVVDGSGKQYVTAQAAAPGERIRIQGTGFGPTNPVRPTGPMVIDPAPLVVPPRIFIGNREARVVSAALVGPGVSEFEVVVPDVADGDQPVVGEISLSITPGGVFLRVQR